MTSSKNFLVIISLIVVIFVSGCTGYDMPGTDINSKYHEFDSFCAKYNGTGRYDSCDFFIEDTFASCDLIIRDGKTGFNGECPYARK